jgi:hypothetical protein
MKVFRPTIKKPQGSRVLKLEGEISQGMSGSQIFFFSVMDKDKQVITDYKRRKDST